MNRRARQPKRRGITLIVVLWVVALLAILVTNFAFLVRTHTMVAGNFANDIRLQTIAEAGIERAIAVLKDDMTPPDSLLEDWAESDADFSEIPIGEGIFSVVRFESVEGATDALYGIEDEASKLNLHTATREMLVRLEPIDGPMAAAILDWQDSDLDVQQDGAEAEYYANLPRPYPCRDRPLTTLEELLLVRGITPELLYGEDWNRNGVLDPSENDGSEHDPPDDGDGVLDRGILPFITIYSKEPEKSQDGKDRIDINNTDEAGLKAGIPGLTDDEAKGIVAHRQTKQFEHLGELLKVTKVKEEPKTDEQQQPEGGKKEGGNRDKKEKDGNGGQEKPPPGGEQPKEDTGERIITTERLKQIVDYCKIGGDATKEGRMNINTATARVLRCLPGMTDDLARAVADSRTQQHKSYNSIADLLDVPGMTEDIFIGVSDFVTVRSNQFRIRSDATIKGVTARKTVLAVVDRSEGEVKILYWNER